MDLDGGGHPAKGTHGARLCTRLRSGRMKAANDSSWAALLRNPDDLSARDRMYTGKMGLLQWPN